MRKKLSAEELAPKLMLVARQMGTNTLNYSTIMSYANSRYVKGYADDDLIDECKRIASKYGVVVVDDINPEKKFTKTDFELSKDDNSFDDLIDAYKKEKNDIVEGANIPKAFNEDGQLYVVGDKVVAKTILDKVGLKYKDVGDRLVLEDEPNNDLIDELNQMFNLKLDESVFIKLKTLRESYNISEKKRIAESNSKFRKIKK